MALAQLQRGSQFQKSFPLVPSTHTVHASTCTYAHSHTLYKQAERELSDTGPGDSPGEAAGFLTMPTGAA